MVRDLSIIYGLLNFILIFVSYFQIRKNPKSYTFFWYLAFFNGAFIWEDFFIFSILHTVGVSISLILADTKIWLLFMASFWLIRSLGETLYQFLEQFIEPKHSPHFISEHFAPILKVFGPIPEQKCFILVQIFFQSVSVISLTALIYLVLNWNNIIV